MKVEIDDRPLNKDNPKPFYCIRLSPETNAEMAALERPIALRAHPRGFIRVPIGDQLHYAIIFEIPE